ncbi:MFS transporter [Comamonas sp. JUb58]|uniref:MFS transporter n=1 Tax=Comamonas sp. JUb58 TaxID=2485114 RepID=UPI0010DADCD0|nr:MFS transporter [Comamonas sp. JUb58]TDS82280.1 sugar phosphate permease [Comamonas sp. JUb58]
MPPSPNRSWWSYENRLLLILFVTFGFVFFDRLALSFLFPFMQEELDLSQTQLGMISSALALTWAISGAIAGAWADSRAKRKALLVVAVLAFSICSALSGLVGGFVSLLVFRALMGLAEGPVLPIAQSLMIQSSTPSRRGLNMGLLQGSSAGLIGAMIGPPVVIGLATHFGWRIAFYVTVIPGILIALSIWRWVHEHPGKAPAAAQAKPAPIDRWALLRERNVLLCMLISCFFLTWFIIIISFAPTFLIQYREFSAGDMGFVMSCLGAAWVFWGFAVPAISDRIGRKSALAIFAPIAALCPIALIYGDSVTALGMVVFVTYTGLGCFTLFMATIPAETVPPQVLTGALGLIMGAGELVGGFLAPTVAGLAADLYGLPAAMWISAGGALVAGVLSLGLEETAPLVVSKSAATEGRQ